LQKITSHSNSNNVAARGLLEKYSFKVGSIKKENHHYILFKEDWSSESG
jgi:ribosomal protein S18 acetylase RimI-like enzyme